MLEYDASADKILAEHVPMSDLAWFPDREFRTYAVVHTVSIPAAFAKQRFPEWNGTLISDSEDVQIKRLIYSEVAESAESGYRHVISIQGDVIREQQNVPYNPYVIFYWNPVTSDAFGRSPVVNNIESIKLLYKLSDMQRAGAEFRALGVHFDPSGSKNDSFKYQPGYIYGGRQAPEPMQFSTDIGFSYTDVDILRGQIGEGMYIFNIPVEDAANITATQSDIYRQQFNTHLGQAGTNLEELQVKPVYKTVNILLTMNDVLQDLKITDGELSIINDEKPLTVQPATTIKTDREFQEWQQQLQVILGTAEVIGNPERFPRAAYVIDIEKWVRDYYSYSGIPDKYLLDELGVTKLIQQRQGAQQQ